MKLLSIISLLTHLILALNVELGAAQALPVAAPSMEAVALPMSLNAVPTLEMFVPSAEFPQAIEQDAAFASFNAYCNGYIPLQSNLTSITGPIKYVQIPTGDIAYIRFGNTTSGKNPLVYIQGFGDTIQTAPFDLLVELSQDREIIAFDNTAQGLSVESGPARVLSIPDMANDTAALISALNLSKPDILGFSMGGFIALGLLQPPYNDAINNILLASSSPGGRNTTQLSREATLRLLNNTKTQYEVALDSYSDTTLGRKAACSRYGTYLSFYKDSENKTTTARHFRAINQRDSSPGDWSVLSTTQTPIWLIAGELDEMVPAADSRTLSSIIPNVWFTLFPKMKHAAFAEDVPSIVSLYDDFSTTWQ